LSRANSIESIRRSLDLAGRELGVLYKISQSISCRLNLDDVLREIIELVVEVTRGDSCLVYLLDESGASLVLRASRIPHPRMIGNITLKVGEGITGWVAQEARPVAIPRHASQDPRFKFFHNLPEDRYEAFLSVPIVAPTERVSGVINVHHRKAHRHTEQEVTLLSIIGHLVGGAIDNARLYEEVKRQAHHLSTLAQVGQIIVSGAYLEEMLRLIVSFISELTQVQGCCILLAERNGRSLVLKAGSASVQNCQIRIDTPSVRSLLARVLREKKPLHLHSVDDCRLPSQKDAGKKGAGGSLLAVPMAVKGHIVGVINVFYPADREFSREEVRVLSTIAHQAGLAIENTKLAMEVQESQEALQTRKVIDRAKGILQKQASLSEGEAYRRLQEQSMRTRKSMREIAEVVILGAELQAP
jgi:GAF domain-containing protein